MSPSLTAALARLSAAEGYAYSLERSDDFAATSGALQLADAQVAALRDAVRQMREREG